MAQLSAALDRLLPAAVAEVQAKTLQQIQVATARTWAARACAYAIVSQGLAKASDEGLRMRASATDCAHEAVEHAALSGSPRLLTEVLSAVKACGVAPF